MFHDGGLGRRMKEALIEPARAAVRVYMLYDEVGSAGLRKSYVNDLNAAGVEVSWFKPTQGWRNRFQLNFRNHRKIVVVDGTTAWVGGHNFGDERCPGHDHPIGSVAETRGGRVAVRHGTAFGEAPHLADGPVLRPGSGSAEGAETDRAPGGGRASHYNRQARQPAGALRRLPFHETVERLGHSLLRLQASLPACDSHARGRRGGDAATANFDNRSFSSISRSRR
jgi:hypothetical protein